MGTHSRGVEQIKNRVEANTDSMLSEAEFRAQFSSLLAKGEPTSIQDHTFFSLPSTTPPWTDTGIDLQAGVGDPAAQNTSPPRYGKR